MNRYVIHVGGNVFSSASASSQLSAIESAMTLTYTDSSIPSHPIPSTSSLSLSFFSPLLKRLCSYFWTDTSRKSVKDYHDTGGSTELDLRSYLVQKKKEVHSDLSCCQSDPLKAERADTPAHWIKQHKHEAYPAAGFQTRCFVSKTSNVV